MLNPWGWASQLIAKAGMGWGIFNSFWAWSWHAKSSVWQDSSGSGVEADMLRSRNRGRESSKDCHQNWCFAGYEGNGWVKGDHRVSSQRKWIYDTAFKRKNKRGELSLEGKERAVCVLGTARQLNETQHSTGAGSLRLIPANRRNATGKISYLRGILRLASSPISLSL